MRSWTKTIVRHLRAASHFHAALCPSQECVVTKSVEPAANGRRGARARKKKSPRLVRLFAGCPGWCAPSRNLLHALRDRQPRPLIPLMHSSPPRSCTQRPYSRLTRSMPVCRMAPTWRRNSRVTSAYSGEGGDAVFDWGWTAIKKKFSQSSYNSMRFSSPSFRTVRLQPAGKTFRSTVLPSAKSRLSALLPKGCPESCQQ